MTVSKRKSQNATVFNIMLTTTLIIHELTCFYFPAPVFSGLPSAPRELVATTTQLAAGKLQLSWSPPEDTGGRSDISYSVECRRCEGTACQPCGEKVRLEPASSGLMDTRVEVSELEPHLNYTFTVEAHSGVSLFASQGAPRSNRPPSTNTLTTALHYTGGSLYLGVILVVVVETFYYASTEM